ncbi:ABC transporter permease [Cohnella lubricantis]|uniref:ABC transporter permease n=1 Tax=Cohnella lubricantis TaxID=2163172 RepID=A0A841TC57_9BACL|nr:ABC transporter permease [Cohnella lubricantis]MBB6678884.1 ABC transporter permease [Cohnella lubricantis]MBP2120209.1 putative spermidine/putrescine transport system permease protein [Cohnella lubricantis]
MGAHNSRWRPLRNALLLLAPVLLVLLVAFVIPMVYIFALSLQNEEQQFSLGNYALFLHDSYYVGILWRTIKLSFYTVLACLVFGYPVAMFMAKASGRMRGVVTFLIIAPHLISVVIRNFGWVVILGNKGWINTTLMNLGIIDKPLKLLYNELGVVIGLTDAYIVYMVLALVTSLYAVDTSLYKAAGILGASSVRKFVSITLPLSLPGILAGSTLVFSLSMSAYVTPALMGGSAVKVLPVLTYENVMITLNWPLSAALSFLLLGSTYALVTIFTKLVETRRYKEVFSGA